MGETVRQARHVFCKVFFSGRFHDNFCCPLPMTIENIKKIEEIEKLIGFKLDTDSMDDLQHNVISGTVQSCLDVKEQLTSDKLVVVQENIEQLDFIHMQDLQYLSYNLSSNDKLFLK